MLGRYVPLEKNTNLEFIVEIVLTLIGIYPGAFIVWAFKGFKGSYSDILKKYDNYGLGVIGFFFFIFLIIALVAINQFS